MERELRRVVVSFPKSRIVMHLYGHGRAKRSEILAVLASGVPSVEEREADWHLLGLYSLGVVERDQEGNEATYVLTSLGKRIARRLGGANA